MASSAEGKTIRGNLLALIRDEGPMPRAELARRLGLSATTITRAVGELEAERILAEGDVLASSGAGRPATNLHILGDAYLVAGVQIGIGVVQLGIFDALGGRRCAEQFNYPVEAGAEALLQRVAESLRALCASREMQGRKLRGVGVAVPGPVDADGRRLLVSIRLGWRDIAVADTLETLTGLPVTVEHNVRSMALAEARFGQGRGLSSVAFVYLRSGLGAGLVVRGQPFSGGMHGAIELGHLPVIEGGLTCVCGGRGCIETVLSEPALLATIRRLRIQPEPNALTALWSASLRRKDATRAIEAIVTPLATGLSALTTLLNPGLVLLGGALADIPDPLFEQIVQASWRGAFPLIRASTRIERSKLGAQAGLVGAATVALDHFLYA